MILLSPRTKDNVLRSMCAVSLKLVDFKPVTFGGHPPRLGLEQLEQLEYEAAQPIYSTISFSTSDERNGLHD
jgi:hypothetical protein